MNGEAWGLWMYGLQRWAVDEKGTILAFPARGAAIAQLGRDYRRFDQTEVQEFGADGQPRPKVVGPFWASAEDLEGGFGRFRCQVQLPIGDGKLLVLAERGGFDSREEAAAWGSGEARRFEQVSEAVEVVQRLDIDHEMKTNLLRILSGRRVRTGDDLLDEPVPMRYHERAPDGTPLLLGCESSPPSRPVLGDDAEDDAILGPCAWCGCLPSEHIVDPGGEVGTLCPVQTPPSRPDEG